MNYADLLATVQAVLAAVAVWQAERDRPSAIAAFESTRLTLLSDHDIRRSAERLSSVLPPSVAGVFERNLRRCWERFEECITDRDNEDELLACERFNRECICANLRSLVRTNGCLPEELTPLWLQFGCGPVPPTC